MTLPRLSDCFIFQIVLHGGYESTPLGFFTLMMNTNSFTNILCALFSLGKVAIKKGTSQALTFKCGESGVSLQDRHVPYMEKDPSGFQECFLGTQTVITYISSMT